MKLLILKATNVFSYKELEIDFSNIESALVRGDTGSGKSSIFDIISLCLFGNCERDNKIIRDTPKAKKKRIANIVLSIDVAGMEYTIERTFASATKLTVYKGDMIIDFRTNVRQAQQYIVDLIGYDYKSYINAVYFTQNDIGAFLNGKSTERIKILERIFDLDFFVYAKKIIKSDISKSVTDKTLVIGEINAVKRTMSEILIDEYIERRKILKSSIHETKAAIEKTEKELNKIYAAESLISERESFVIALSRAKEKATDTIDQYKSAIQKFESVIVSAKDSTEKFVKTKVLYDRFYTVDSEIVNIGKKIDNNQSVISKHKTIVDVLESEIKSINRFIDSDVCHTCNRPIRKGDIVNWEIDIQSKRNKIEKSIAIISETKSVIEDLETSYARLQQKKNDLIVRVKLNTEQSVVRQQAINAKRDIVEYTDRIKEVKTKYNTRAAELKDAITKLGKQIKLVDYEKRIPLEDALRELRDYLIEYSADYRATDQTIKQWYIAKSRLKELRLTLKEIKLESNAPLYWNENIDKVKIQMLSKIVPYISDIANNYLQHMLNGNTLNMTVDPNKQINKIDVIISNTNIGVTRDYKAWSGGQKDIMSLAAYMAFNKMIAVYRQKKIGFIILDEKFTGMDSAKRDAILDFIKHEFSGRSIFAISHLDGMDKYFNTVINTKIKNGISTISIS